MSDLQQIPMPQAQPGFEMYVVQMLSAHSSEFESFRRDLLGNGQPGRIQRIESSVTALDTKTALSVSKLYDRIGGISKRAAFLSGGIAGIGFLIGIAVHFWKP